MKKTIYEQSLSRLGLAASALLLALALSGCIFVRTPVVGALYTEVRGPVTATSAKGPTKTGTACASSILGLWATGDASIQAATSAAGISEVSWVDEDARSLAFGVYGDYCVTVRGN
jgi:TRL (tRNA-associated locus)-like protein